MRSLSSYVLSLIPEKLLNGGRAILYVLCPPLTVLSRLTEDRSYMRGGLLNLKREANLLEGKCNLAALVRLSLNMDGRP